MPDRGDDPSSGPPPRRSGGSSSSSGEGGFILLIIVAAMIGVALAGVLYFFGMEWQEAKDQAKGIVGLVLIIAFVLVIIFSH